MPKAEELFTLNNVKFLRESDKAILIEIHDEEIWIPLSQVTDIDRDAGTITLTEWIAKQKNLR